MLEHNFNTWAMPDQSYFAIILVWLPKKIGAQNEITNNYSNCAGYSYKLEGYIARKCSINVDNLYTPVNKSLMKIDFMLIRLKSKLNHLS